MPDYDLVVVGGGIHGVGVAQAASAAGYRTLLIEKNALASGTSSRSSKLIHGGLRYLESGQLRLVKDNIKERELLLKLAPGLIHRLDFYLPIYANASRSRFKIDLGLKVYDLMSASSDAPRSRHLTQAEWSNLDELSTDNLHHVFVYPDAQTDDAALTRAVMASAQSLGAELACPATVTAISLQTHVCTIQYQQGPQTHSVSSVMVVNAMGPWALENQHLFDPPLPRFDYEKVAGTHIECPGLDLPGAFYVESPRDHRGIFILPWGQRTLIGTTEDPFDRPADQVVPTPASIDYLLQAYQAHFPKADTQVLNAWAGLRVLPKGSNTFFHRSRETALHLWPDDKPRVLTILGGKLTGYRNTASRVIQQLAPHLPYRKAIADTAELMLGQSDAQATR